MPAADGAGIRLLRVRLTRLGFALTPFLASLLLFGWAVGMFTAALILRFGQAAEAPAFALNAVYLAAGALFFRWMLERVREKGYLGRLGME